MVIRIWITIAKYLSAGSVGNLQLMTAPNPSRESRYSVIFYFLQFIAIIPGVISIFHPLIATFYFIGMRIWYAWLGVEANPHTPSDLVFVILFFIALDFQ